MGNEEVFRLSVRTGTYRGGIETRTSTQMLPKSELGLASLYTALYETANACALRHEQLAVMDNRGVKPGG